jgi:hypothetical protein
VRYTGNGKRLEHQPQSATADIASTFSEKVADPGHERDNML